jgi:hypothetical protein
MATRQGGSNGVSGTTLILNDGQPREVTFDTIVNQTTNPPWVLGGGELRINATGTYQVSYSVTICGGTGNTGTLPIFFESAVLRKIVNTVTSQPCVGSNLVNTLPGSNGTPGVSAAQLGIDGSVTGNLSGTTIILGNTFIADFFTGDDLDIIVVSSGSPNSVVPFFIAGSNIIFATYGTPVNSASITLQQLR